MVKCTRHLNKNLTDRWCIHTRNGRVKMQGCGECKLLPIVHIIIKLTHKLIIKRWRGVSNRARGV